MALIQCSECGKQISDKAKACPECGCPIDIITGITYESNSAMCVHKSINDYNYKELDEKYNEYGIRQLFNIAVNYHYDIIDGALEAAFIYKYITERYPHNTEASKSRKMLDKLTKERPCIFLVSSSHTVKVSDTSKNSTSKPSVITALPIGLIIGALLGVFLAKIFMSHNTTDDSFQVWLFVAVMILFGTPLTFSLTKFRHKGIAAFMLMLVSMNIGSYIGFIVGSIRS